MKLIVPKAVERELEEAARWYEEQRPGLRVAFLDAVEEAFSWIVENPQLYPTVHLDIRRAPLRRFPYSVYYFLPGKVIRTLAVVHDARHPSVWQRRRR